MKKRYLALENGKVFEGYAFGSDNSASGELVFTTGMCGYIETLTDPASSGKIVLFTFPLIGNYGMIDEDSESSFNAFGCVCREICAAPSNFRCEYPLDEFLKKRDIPGICGVDTREITKILKSEGTQAAVITDSLDAVCFDTEEILTSTKEIYTVGNGDIKIAALDLGIKKSTAAELAKRNCTVTVYPCDTSAEDILKDAPDGIFISSGKEDLSLCDKCADTIKTLFEKSKMLALGTGHLALAKALGADIVKLKSGHRGANQPSKDMLSGKTYVTEQNHSYTVDNSSIKQGKVRFVNVNDGSVEGLQYENALSLQFYPGAYDTSFLYDEFISLTGGNK